MRILILVFLLLCIGVMFLFSQNSSSLTIQNPDSGKFIERMDKEMGNAKNTEKYTFKWVNAKDLTVEGMGWSGTGVIDDYTRLPNNYKDTVTANVWNLSRHSSGIHVRFTVKGTKEIHAKWKLRSNIFMVHMTHQAINGLDLYIKQDGKWVFGGVGKPDKTGLDNESLLTGFLDPKVEYECMVYLPLYNGVNTVEFGFASDAQVKKATPFHNKPFVMYGTSILHGCSASRAGMSFPSMLGRRFDAPVVNLGFSGNGFIEEYFGRIMGEVDALAYFIDCLPNMYSFTPDEVKSRTLALVRNLRKVRPQTPVVLVEDRTHTNFRSNSTVNEDRDGLKAAYKILKKESENIYYVKSDNLLGKDTEATVDGSHPSDLGMHYYYQALEPVVKKIMKVSKKSY